MPEPPHKGRSADGCVFAGRPGGGHGRDQQPAAADDDAQRHAAHGDLRAALRSRPHGVVIGEARGAEAWELIRAAATGHGHSAFAIHATSAEHVWPRFLQVVQAHPDAARMSEIQIVQSSAEAATAAVYIERNPQQGQIVREIVDVSAIVERTAARPSFSPLFRFEQGKGLLPTGNRPMRPGLRASDLNLPETFFKASV